MAVALASSRRDLLKGTGALVIAVAFTGSRSQAAPEGLPVNLPAPKSVALDQVDTFLAIDDKGMVSVYAGKVELGTGVRTGFTQIVADELDVPMDHVNVIQGDMALTPDQGPTYGSLSIQNGGVQLRQAAATARGALLDAAAVRMGASVSLASNP
jgi:CO/xanthine dehydrogenase Mo-binding subunit